MPVPGEAEIPEGAREALESLMEGTAENAQAKLRSLMDGMNDDEPTKDEPERAAQDILGQVNQAFSGRMIRRVAIDEASGAFCVEASGGHVLMLHGVTSVGMGRSA